MPKDDKISGLLFRDGLVLLILFCVIFVIISAVFDCFLAEQKVRDELYMRNFERIGKEIKEIERITNNPKIRVIAEGIPERKKFRKGKE